MFSSNYTELFQFNRTQIAQFKAKITLPRTHIQSATSNLNPHLARVAAIVRNIFHGCARILIERPDRTLAYVLSSLLALLLLCMFLGPGRYKPVEVGQDLQFLNQEARKLESMSQTSKIGFETMIPRWVAARERASAAEAQLARIQPGTQEIQRRLNNLNQFAQEMRRFLEGGQERYIGNVQEYGLVLDHLAVNMNDLLNGSEDLKNLCDKVVGQFNQL